MSNFFEGLWGLVKHPIDEAEFLVKGARDVIKGDRSVGDLFGDHQDMMSENITVPLGGRNKLTENSDAVAGTIVGSVLAAPMVMGGSGAGASSAAGAGNQGVWGSFLNSPKSVGSYLTNAWDSFTTPANKAILDKISALPEGASIPDELLAELAEAEAGGAVSASTSTADKVAGALKSMGNMSARTGQSKMNFTGGGKMGGGGFNVQTEDQYASAMKALVDKYGQFMFNKDF